MKISVNINKKEVTRSTKSVTCKLINASRGMSRRICDGNKVTLLFSSYCLVSDVGNMHSRQLVVEKIKRTIFGDNEFLLFTEPNWNQRLTLSGNTPYGLHYSVWRKQFRFKWTLSYRLSTHEIFCCIELIGFVFGFRDMYMYIGNCVITMNVKSRVALLVRKWIW